MHRALAQNLRAVPPFLGALGDVRGPAGRTRDIAAAIRTAIARNEDADTIDQRIQAPEDGGLPLSLW